MPPSTGEQPRQFTGTPRFNALSSGSVASSSRSYRSSATIAGNTSVSRATQLGIGLGGKGKGLGKTGLKRHKKVQRDTIMGITPGDIRRLARRGGIKRISATVYNDVRVILKERLKLILGNIIPLVEHSNRKTISVTDVVFTLNRLGKPIYGFQDNFDGRHRT
ncbi:histone-fold-containing protein [Periconia macrospinosa]|uniref:Histone H4 n=1 Tax=Periconia macrospinosa TaxID=97972 RepID=A0A2V1DC46_9PLEO|nr:histone-fold-containing protein [Periconia macrospinosa]